MPAGQDRHQGEQEASEAALQDVMSIRLMQARQIPEAAGEAPYLMDIPEAPEVQASS